MNPIFNEVYKNKKILVTGHTGFKGSWLCLWLLLAGAEVVGFSLEPETNPSLFKVLNLEKYLDSIIGDIRDKKLIENVVSKIKPDFIFHLAAQPIVRRSYKEPILTFETNIMGTVNLLEAVRKNGLETIIINITSDKCYDNKENVCSYSETDPMGGYDPYSASKGAVEIITSSYRNSFFNSANYDNHKIALASARAGNVIGGGDWAEDRLIPDIIRALTEKEDVIIRNPNSTRPWQHVLECISGYLTLGEKLFQNPNQYCEGWNFGPEPGSIMAVQQIVNKTIDLWGSGNYRIIPDENMKEAVCLSLNIAKAKEKLGWQPVYDINQAVEKTICWYQHYYFRQDAILEYTKKQIENYSELFVRACQVKT